MLKLKQFQQQKKLVKPPTENFVKNILVKPPDVNEEINGFLSLPFSLTLSGCSGSGKSFFVRKLLLNQRDITGSEWKKIFYISRFEFRPSELMHLPIEYIHGVIPSLEELKKKSAKNEQNLVILDDLMSQSANSSDVKSLFSEGRHINFSVIYCTQNLFQGGKFARTIRLNTNFMLLFKQIHDRLQIMRFFVSMRPKEWKFLMDFYDDATNEPFGYLLLDFRPQITSEILRMRTCIEKNSQILYIEKP